MIRNRLKDYDRGLIAGLGLAIEGVDMAIKEHSLTPDNSHNLIEFKGCLERARDIYKKKCG